MTKRTRSISETSAIGSHDTPMRWAYNAGGPRRTCCTLGAMCARRHLASPHRRLGDNGGQLLLRVLRRAPRLLFRQYARACEHFDPIGSALDILPDLLAQFVYPIRDPVEPF